MTVLEATLSMMLKTGLKPLLVKYMMFPLKVAIFDSSFKSLTGVARISLDDHYYITKTYVFPSIDLIGDFPVNSTYMVPSIVFSVTCYKNR